MGQRTAEELEDLGLTEEELAGLEDDEQDEDTDAAGEGEGEGADENKTGNENESGTGEEDGADEAGEDDDDAGDKADAGDAGETDAAAADAAAADTAAAEEAKAAAAPDTGPKWQEPEDVSAQLNELNAKRDALADKFDDGELTAKELFSEQRKIDDEILDLKMAAHTARARNEAIQSAWTDTTVANFLESHQQYRDNERLFAMLDQEVRTQQQAAIDAGGNPFAPSILENAHKSLTEAFSAALGTTPAAAKSAKAAPAAGKTELPPTLANLPASDMHVTDGGKYASLDRLANSNPIAYEDALAKLSDADREAYLSQ